MDRSLGARLARHPIIATLYGTEQIDALLDSPSEIAIVANVGLRKLHAVVGTITRADKIVTLARHTTFAAHWRPAQWPCRRVMPSSGASIRSSGKVAHERHRFLSRNRGMHLEHETPPS